MKKGYIAGTILFLVFPIFVFGADEKPVAKETNEPATIVSGWVEKIKFKEGSFGDDLKKWVITGLEDTEIWRAKVADNLVPSIDKVKDSRKDKDNMKPEIQVMSFLHLWALQILKFILSVGFVFYGLALVFVVIILKKIFAFLGWIFRRRAEKV